MKILILTLVLVSLNVLGFASPLFIETSNNITEVIYIDTVDDIDIYTTGDSLAFLGNYTTYRESKMWQLKIMIAPSTEELRTQIVKELSKKNNISWLNTPSGSRRFWAISYTTSYLPKDKLLILQLPEDYLNDNGELLGIEMKEPRMERHYLDDPNKNIFFRRFVESINKYLERTFPAKKKSMSPIE